MIQEPQETTMIKTSSASHQRNDARVKRDQEELEALLKQARGETDETEEVVEAKPSSEAPVEPKVQAESSAKQKEESEGEAQEDDAELSGEEKTFKQRYSDIRRHMQDKEKDFSAKLEKLEKQLDLATKNELVLPKSEEEIDAWARKYPDVAGIVEAIAAKEADKKSSSLDARLLEIEELRSTAKREKAEAELLGMHSDLVSIRDDDAFHTWADNQPKWVQDALYENSDDAASVIRVIDLYKVDNGMTKSDYAAKRKAAAGTVKKASKVEVEADDAAGSFKESDIARMSTQEYEKQEDAITKAIQSGKFIYDLSIFSRHFALFSHFRTRMQCSEDFCQAISYAAKNFSRYHHHDSKCKPCQHPC